MQEIWKDIVGYEGLYQISNHGVVRSICGRYGDIVILKQAIGSSGYPFVSLCNRGNQKSMSVHKLVARAFLPNPNNYPCVNHKDEIKTNNHADNLEWCSYQHNNVYGNRLLKYSISRSKMVYCIETNAIYSSATYAAKCTGLPQTSISRCCRERRKDIYGNHWTYWKP